MRRVLRVQKDGSLGSRGHPDALGTRATLSLPLSLSLLLFVVVVFVVRVSPSCSGGSASACTQ